MDNLPTESDGDAPRVISLPDGSRVATMARHIRVGTLGYQSLDGTSLNWIKVWNGRVRSIEVLVTDLAATLRSSEFRPFRSFGFTQPESRGEIRVRLTGIHETRKGFYLPWKPRLCRALLSLQLECRTVIRKTFQGTSHQSKTSMYDVTATITGGIAVLKKGHMSSVSGTRFDNLISGAVERILKALDNSTVKSS